MRRHLVYLFAAILPFVSNLSAAAELTAEKASSVVTGSVSYLQRIALPKEAVVEVQLVDVSLQDAPAIVISEQTYTGKQVPIHYSLSYEPKEIKPTHDYAVQANITVNGKLLFINTQRYSVLTKGSENKADLVLEMVK
ncbi:YbaY family lipoprotein [Endozoicomonas sp. SM1973]|uniref:YbaY family lipoprotein n=1 Tax=Spartinivicinus marinus TaxID=2994442 RepID=A0A853IL51_9GAMM|nr:YbaY family lipoprotein [Spartinivicinus marinus]MCX4027320.1 YbaY family lipoprotein [Spartinivicinus marinus]NYZ68456.1 YbaY family lipoprotein [Spartinivicinus marinus]